MGPRSSQVGLKRFVGRKADRMMAHEAEDSGEARPAAGLPAQTGSRRPAVADFHRRETAVSRLLPTGAPVPRLLDGYDDGDWVALLLVIR